MVSWDFPFKDKILYLQRYRLRVRGMGGGGMQTCVHVLPVEW